MKTGSKGKNSNRRESGADSAIELREHELDDVAGGAITDSTSDEITAVRSQSRVKYGDITLKKGYIAE